MASQAAVKLDESLINFYDEQLVAHADAIYRFAFAITLSLDGAAQCARKTFKAISQKLPEAHGKGDANVLLLLVRECWKTYGALKGQKFTEGQSAVTKALKPIAIEARAALIAVDVCGLAPSEAGEALAWSEKDVRVKLAEARRALMMSTLDV